MEYYNNSSDLGKYLEDYVKDPENADLNFSLAVLYENTGQTASAVSFYLRAAERSKSVYLAYECLIRAAGCFEKQGARNFTVKGLLQHAVALFPGRAEAYFLLSRFYERQSYDGHWNDCYMMASIGDLLEADQFTLRTDIGYPGNWGCKFEKAVSAWWCGLCDESRTLFEELITLAPLDSTHYLAVMANLKQLGSSIGQYTPFEIYTSRESRQLKWDQSKRMSRNYSEAFQDMFILAMLGYSCMRGTYLEIGAGHPIYGNNTFLLESTFEWTGVSIDIDSATCDLFNTKRKNKCICADAQTVNFHNLLGVNPQSPYSIVSYLQLDCDPPSTTYEILTKIPFDDYRFKIITYEHDAYLVGPEYQDKAHQLLESKGYLRVVKNVSPDGVRSYEDWYVHPEYVNMDIVRAFANTDDTIKKAKNLFIK